MGNKRGPYFEGWYVKCQTKKGQSLAFIPALHIDRAGKSNASLQVISDQGAWWLEYPEGEFRADGKAFEIQAGPNRFTKEGAILAVERDGLSLWRRLQFGPFTALQSPIMGPFRFLPGMECAHGVISMGHGLKGILTLNGREMDFDGGMGYVETDRGRSFPRAYLWTQCLWGGIRGTSVMLSIATIPLGAVGFTGCICAVVHQGREYRLATYRGVRIEQWSGSGAVIRQGKYRLAVEVLEGAGQPLRAPVEGAMARTIHESLCARLRYRFWEGKKLLFDHVDSHASFEYAGGAEGSASLQTGKNEAF